MNWMAQFIAQALHLYIRAKIQDDFFSPKTDFRAFEYITQNTVLNIFTNFMLVSPNIRIKTTTVFGKKCVFRTALYFKKLVGLLDAISGF